MKRAIVSAMLPIGLALGSCGQASEEKDSSVRGQPYGECIKTLLEPSFAIMDRMAAQGLDLEKSRPITHLLVGPEDAISKAAQFAQSKGFNVVEQGKGRLVIGEDAPVIEDWIKHTIPVFCSFAEEYQLTYDGWDVDVSEEGLKRD